MKRLIFLSLIVFFTLMSCFSKRDIKLGFLGCISGKLGDLGVAGRDGAILAVEKINNEGGINGRKIDLLVEDNGLDVDLCRKSAQSLIDSGVEALIGPMTSEMTLACFDQFNDAQIPIISPTASTSQLSDKDDYFFRVFPSFTSEATELAKYTMDVLEAENIAVIYDTLNESFTKGLYQVYRDSVSLSKTVNIDAYTFLSTEDSDFKSLAQSILSNKPDTVLIIASPLYTAMFCQLFGLAEADVNILATSWAMTEDLITQGGKAVDGVVFSHYYNNNSDAPAYKEFLAEFESYFNRTPNFISVLSYNAVMVWAEAYTSKESEQEIKERIVEIKTFQGLQSKIIINEYGDAFLERHYIIIENGVFTNM